MTSTHDSARHRTAEQLGRSAETASVTLLHLNGWIILARRYRSGRGLGAGEIDLIAQQGRLVAFIEVKARKTNVADALAAITANQRRRIALGAEAFLQSRPDLADCDCRFDVVVVVPGSLPLHIPDAWRVGD